MNRLTALKLKTLKTLWFQNVSKHHSAPKLWSQELSRLVAEAAAGRSILAMDGAMGAMAMAMAWQDWTKDRTIYKLY